MTPVGEDGELVTGRGGLRTALQAHPDARVELADGPRPVTGRAAVGEERGRLWTRWQEIDKHLDAYAARRPTETAVVILEPRPPTEPRP